LELGKGVLPTPSKGDAMSALSIIVGGWLLLNAVVFAALMLRHDQPELRDRLFRLVVDERREVFV
jgi:hypothetical protein